MRSRGWLAAAAALLAASVAGSAQEARLRDPARPIVSAFHHVHMNVVDPEKSATFYAAHFDSTRVNVAGWSGVRADGVDILFTKVGRQASHEWDSAIWHFGWSSPATTDDYQRIAAAGVKFFRVPPPSAHMIGPDLNDVEIAPGKERFFNHVHLQSEAPLCAADWYERVVGLAHLPDVGRAPGADCHVPFHARSNTASQILNPNSRVIPGSGPFALFVYPNQRLRALSANAVDDRGPLVSSRGHVIDHIAFAVADLDDALRRLRGQNVPVIEKPHRFGKSAQKAAMIEGPDKIAIELVEVR
jgi:hypothetical protein